MVNFSQPSTSPEIEARHLAGHLVYAIAAGVFQDRRPLPLVLSECFRGYNFPRPRLVDCNADSLWMTAWVRLCLAGDRAVRLAGPHVESVGGGAGSDYDLAVRADGRHVLSVALPESGDHLSREAWCGPGCAPTSECGDEQSPFFKEGRGSSRWSRESGRARRCRRCLARP